MIFLCQKIVSLMPANALHDLALFLKLNIFSSVSKISGENGLFPREVHIFSSFWTFMWIFRYPNVHKNKT